MDNFKEFTLIGSDDNWRTQNFRQIVVTKIEEVIETSGMQIARNSTEMENHVFSKARTREEYLIMVAKLILHMREMSQLIQNRTPNMQGQNQNQAGPTNLVLTQQGQPQQGSDNQPEMVTDPINALQNMNSNG